MKTPLVGVGFLALAGFALLATGCVSAYDDTSPASAYSGTSLPAASRVALVMEFRGGEPSPQERAEVRALLADYLAGQGSVLVESAADADYLVHAVLERRNPENPAEWTVVNTYSAQSLSAAGGDVYRWPGGLIEDDYYTTTRFTYIGFGVFYPVWFDLWDSPWHRGRVIVCPPPRRHDHYRDHSWRDERRWHRPDRWSGARPRDWQRPPERRREEPRPLPERFEPERRRSERRDVHRADPPRGGDHRSDRDRGRDRTERSRQEQNRGAHHDGDKPTLGRETGRPGSHWTPPGVRPNGPRGPQNPPVARPGEPRPPHVNRSPDGRQESPRVQPPADRRPRTIYVPGQGVITTRSAAEPPKPAPAVREHSGRGSPREHPPRPEARRREGVPPAPPQREAQRNDSREGEHRSRRDRADDAERNQQGPRR